MLVIRKSIDSSRSSLPCGALVPGDVARPQSGGGSSARSVVGVPSRWRRKYSLPLPEEPSRFARHTSAPAEVLRGVRVLDGELQPARPQLVDDVLGGVMPARSASSARSRGLRSNVGYDGIQPSRADWAMASIAACRRTAPGQRRRECVGAAAVVAPLVGVQVEERRADHLPRRARQSSAKASSATR